MKDIMNIKFFMALFLLVFLSSVTYPFVRFHLLINGKNTILILADYHFAQELAQKDQKQVDLFMQNALSSQAEHIPCIFELDDIGKPLLTNQALVEGHSVAISMAQLCSYIVKGIAREKLNFFPFDPRGFDSILLTRCSNWLSEELLPHAVKGHSLLSQEDWDTKLKPNFLHTPEAKNYSIKDYFSKLNENISQMRCISEKYSSHEIYGPLFKELESDFVKAMERARSFFANSNFDRSVILAVLDTFDNNLEPAKFIQKYKLFHKTILEDIDYKYFDFCCLDKMLSLCPQTSNKLVLIAGLAHAMNICKLLERLGYQTILEEINDVQLNNGGTFCANSFANLELAFSLFFLQESIPAKLLPNLKLLTLTTAKAYEETIANRLKNHPGFRLENSEATQSTISSAQSETPSAVAHDFRCHNNGCQNKGTHICTRCRQVRYCRKDCQIKDWGAKHKFECKPQIN